MFSGGGIFDFGKNSDSILNTDTTSYTRIDNLWKSDIGFDMSKMKLLFNMLANKTKASLKDIEALGTKTAADIRANTTGKTSSKDIIVSIDNLDWEVVYLSKSIDGNTILTLWLSNNRQPAAWAGKSATEGDFYGFLNGSLYSDWSANWYDPNFAQAYPSNMYSTSYIHVVTLNNGGKYIAPSGSGGLTTFDPTSSSVFANFTSSSELPKYIVRPSYVSWQKDQSARNTAHMAYDLPNDSITGSNGKWYTGSYNSSDMTGKSRYQDWGNDFIWLPSIAETGYNDTYSGLWKLSVSQRQNGMGTDSSLGSVGKASGEASQYTWLRSGYYLSANYSYVLDPSGSDCNDFTVNSSRAVRPAFHLNLSKIVKDYADDWSLLAATSFGGGTGSSSSPYLISTAEQLAYLANRVNSGTSYSGSYFKQTADINLGGHEWVPIGNASNNFSGSYDGKGFKISGININSTDSDVGLFGKAMMGGSLSNINIADGYIYTTGTDVAAIAGEIQYFTVTNCTNNAHVEGAGSVGGIVGSTGSSASIENCVNYGNILATGNSAGGIIASCGGSISNNINYGSVTGAQYVGGIVGSSSGSCSANISNCNIVGEDYVGGIAGEVLSSYSSIKDCAAFGHLQITGKGTNCGGIVGAIGEAGTAITACSFVGASNISVPNAIYGGSAKPTITASYVWINSSKKISTALTDSSWTSNWAVVNGINNGLPIQKALYHIANAVTTTTAQIQSALTGFSI